MALGLPQLQNGCGDVWAKFSSWRDSLFPVWLDRLRLTHLGESLVRGESLSLAAMWASLQGVSVPWVGEGRQPSLAQPQRWPLSPQAGGSRDREATAAP